MKHAIRILITFLVFSFVSNVFSQDNSIFRLDRFKGLPSNEVYDSYLTEDGALILATNNGVVLYDGRSIMPFEDVSNSAGEVFKFSIIEKGVVLGITKNSIVNIDTESLLITQTKYSQLINSLENERAIISEIHQVDDSLVFLRVNQLGYIKLSIETGKGYCTGVGRTSEESTTEVKHLPGTKILYRTIKEVEDKKDLKNYVNSDFYFFDSLIKCEELILPIGRFEMTKLNDSVSCFTKEKNLFFYKHDKVFRMIPLPEVIICQVYKDGSLWFGTRSKGLLQLDLKTFKFVKTGISNGTITSINHLNKQVILTTLDDGVLIYNRGIEGLIKVDGLIDFLVQEKQMLVAEGNRQVSLVDLASNQRFYLQKDRYLLKILSNNYNEKDVEAYFANRNQIWLQTELMGKPFQISFGGVLTIGDSVMRTFKPIKWTVLSDSILFILSDGYLNKINVVNYNETSEILKLNYSNFTQCKKQLYFSLNNKIDYSIDGKAFSYAIDSGEKLINLEYYDGCIYGVSKSELYRFQLNAKGQIINHVNINSRINAENVKLQIKNHHLYLGTKDHIYRISLSVFEDELFQDIEVFLDSEDDSFHQDSTVIIKTKVRMYGFDSDKRELRYRDNKGEWLMTNDETLRMYGLSSGAHLVEIQFRFRGQDWSDVYSVSFNVRKPFWRTGWFVVLISLTIVLLIVFVSYLFSNLVKKRKNKEIERLHLEQNALKAQMNPHFTFNSLNSAMYFVIKDEKEKAINYISKFSRLLRTSLDHSNEEKVSLESELNHLKLYLEIESTRFEDVFEYVIDVEDSINLSAVKIPPMLIQPMVENSIWHGLQGLEGEKKLCVKISETEKILIVEVDDNGVGITDSNSHSEKQSYGLRNTKKRLKLFNQGKITDSFQILNKAGYSNEHGVLVIMKLIKE